MCKKLCLHFEVSNNALTDADCTNLSNKRLYSNRAVTKNNTLKQQTVNEDKAEKLV